MASHSVEDGAMVTIRRVVDGEGSSTEVEAVGEGAI